MIRKLIVTLLFAVLGLAANAQEEKVVYKGKIGTFEITMYLTRENFEWKGYYVYNDRPKTKFTLKCVSDEPDPRGWNDVEFKEYTPKGNNTGTFKGRMEGRGDGFYGKFITKGKTLDFNLVQQYE
ncbi:MAG: hypothetical protein II844_09530 [Prevotella sp.]|nr:hypothetical protein [Prevotella sp.]